MGPYRSYHAPAENGAALVDPPWAEQRELARRPLAEYASSSGLTLAGVGAEELVADARVALLDAAHRYTRRFADASAPPTPSPEGPLVVSGHQPELFHPGVWFKNFALDALARSVGGAGVHLLIDTDLCREAGVRVPSGSVDRPRVETVWFDGPAEPVPYEQRGVVDPRRFEAFAERVAEAITPLVDTPLVGTLWRHTLGACDVTDRLGEATSAGRRAIEADAGLETLELPFSRVCDTPSFRRFVFTLVERADAFRDACNAALGDYRAAHKLRNAAQPLPDLRGEGGAVETAFWCWSDEAPARRPLLARRVSGGTEIGDGVRTLATLPASADEAIERLGELRERGVKIRSRALATTLYCRWFLADLFLHGIGGAKYDQVTDRLSERFFGVAPPPHATLSATLRLPIDDPREGARSPAELRGELRELRYHPELHARHTPEAEPWIEQKRRAISEAKTPENAARRHRAIVEANAALAAQLADRREAIERRLRSAIERQQADAILDAREYAFCLFPETLVGRLDRLARGGQRVGV